MENYKPFGSDKTINGAILSLNWHFSSTCNTKYYAHIWDNIISDNILHAVLKK